MEANVFHLAKRFIVIADLTMVENIVNIIIVKIVRPNQGLRRQEIIEGATFSTNDVMMTSQ